eukprot:TRINITY_DN2864_c0_g1_i1.p1 TRINITY_DN2864_c0_g1~~TRINITY_DN2864_c0_g1_i1.p1  ORF type:complete len:593 (+),score=214.47 TRINITY_DN2864_c0_g1_i1:49-1827(+)
MQRPPSSGMGMGMGTSRPPSGGMRPPSSGFGVGGRGGAPMGSRAGPGSSYGVMAGIGSALNTQFEVTARPVMTQGMKGIAPESSGPGRHVADRSYYLGLLRTKNAELQAEIERLKKQEEQRLKAVSSMSTVDKKNKELTAAIATLKEQLADYNFAVSKAGNDVDTITKELEELRQRNQDQRERGDKVFLEVKAKEQKAKEIEDSLRQQLAEMDEKLNADPEKRARYYSLREQTAKLQDELLPKQRDLETLQKKVSAFSKQLEADRSKQAALKLQEKKKKLVRKKQELQDLMSPSGELPDEKERLRVQVKNDNTEIEQLTKQLEEGKAEIEGLTKQIEQAKEQLKAFKGDNLQKYKELEEKDREMQEFIDHFEDHKRDVIGQISKTEETIVKLLEAIGKDMASKENIPSAEQVQDIQADLEFKRKQMIYSQNTHERLKNELELRKKELEKVNNLDSKITSELEAISDKIRQHEEAIKKYSNLDALRQDAEQRKRELQVQKNRSLKLRDALKQNVHLLSQNRYEVMRQALTENETHKSLETLEHKIRVVQQNVFALSDFIAQKGSESDYLPLKAECLKMCEQINRYIKEQTQPK